MSKGLQIRDGKEREREAYKSMMNGLSELANKVDEGHLAFLAIFRHRYNIHSPDCSSIYPSLHRGNVPRI